MNLDYLRGQRNESFWLPTGASDACSSDLSLADPNELYRLGASQTAAVELLEMSRSMTVLGNEQAHPPPWWGHPIMRNGPGGPHFRTLPRPLPPGTDLFNGSHLDGANSHVLPHDLDHLSNQDGRSKWNDKNSQLSFKDRNLLQSLEKIANLSDQMDLPESLRDRAKEMYVKVVDLVNLKNLAGGKRDGIIAACLYAACRQEGVPRTFKEICSSTSVSKREIGRCYKLILGAIDASVTQVSTNDFMTRFCTKLGLSLAFVAAASHVAKMAVELDIVRGKGPLTVTAAAIHLVSKLGAEKRPLKKIADVAGVAELTIRNCYKDLCAHVSRLLPANLASDADHSLLTHDDGLDSGGGHTGDSEGPEDGYHCDTSASPTPAATPVQPPAQAPALPEDVPMSAPRRSIELAHMSHLAPVPESSSMDTVIPNFKLDEVDLEHHPDDAASDVKIEIVGNGSSSIAGAVPPVPLPFFPPTPTKSTSSFDATRSAQEFLVELANIDNFGGKFSSVRSVQDFLTMRKIASKGQDLCNTSA